MPPGPPVGTDTLLNEDHDLVMADLTCYSHGNKFRIKLMYLCREQLQKLVLFLHEVLRNSRNHSSLKLPLLVHGLLLVSMTFMKHSRKCVHIHRLVCHHRLRKYQLYLILYVLYGIIWSIMQ